MTIETDIQTPSPGDKVELFELDASILGGSVHRFCSSVNEGSAIAWQTNTYMPMPVIASGFDLVSKGALPTPTLKLRDATGIFRAKLTRYQTFRKYLDGEAQADPNAHFPVDIYYVERKTKQIGIEIEWQLAAKMDQQGKKLPGRIVLKNVCDYVYRIWGGSAFDYSKATCPYTGTDYFDQAGNVSAQADDVCGQRLSDCQLRYGKAALPFRGFPGVSNVRN